jgi:hypothetical protein
MRKFQLIIWVLIALYLCLASAACSLFGIQDVDSPDYRLVLSDGDKEIRKYEEYIEACTIAGGDYEESGDKAFRRLFDYISGENVPGEEIEMTAPVTQEKQGEKIEMTVPVKQQSTDGGWRMGFILPAKYSMENTPSPTDESIKLVKVPSETRAVLQYTWFTDDEKIRRLGDELAAWAESKGYTPVGEPVSARYDPPWTIPFLRKNEIWIRVEKE